MYSLTFIRGRKLFAVTSPSFETILALWFALWARGETVRIWAKNGKMMG